MQPAPIPSTETDTDLVKRVLAGEPRAFEALIQRYQRLVSHLVFRLVKQTEAREDLCQDIFIKVYRQLPRFRFESKLSTWIGTIAYHTAITALGKQPAMQEQLDELGADNPALADPADLEASHESTVTSSYIHHLMERLAIDDRCILTFYYLEEMGVEEIACIMNKPAGTIKSDLYRARQKLRHMIERETRDER